MDYSVCNMVAINEKFIKAFFNLNLNKVALSYDLHDEKQVYPPHNKNLCKNLRG